MGTRRRHLLGWLLSLVPAVVLLYAAFLKGLDPLLFAEQITAHRITPASWSQSLACLFILAELVIGIALLLRIRPAWTHAVFIAMMLGFIVATSIAWAHGDAKECGCFGRAVGQGPTVVILRDSVLILVSVACLLFLRGARTPRRSVAAAGILLPLAIAFTAFGQRLPADSLATGIGAGSDLTDLPIEDLRRPHTEEAILLVLVDGKCTACARAVPRMNEIADACRGRMRVAAVYSGTGREAMAWRMKHLPAFPVAHASPRALRAYYRSLPTCFLLENGRLERAFWGRIPTLGDLEVASASTEQIVER